LIREQKVIVESRSMQNVSGPIVAAGGLLWRESEEGRQLAVIFRSRYHEWALPKGKAAPGESLEETALREVREETGYEATLGQYAGAIQYIVKGNPKVVHFWNMFARGISHFQPSEEVERVEWMRPEDVLALLKHEEEARVLRSQMNSTS
jgi:8-oxo-dGTP pyrophosphatase MutT (NUDIX family)